MPAKSRAQQKLFGWALSYKRGEIEKVPSTVKKLADSMSEKELQKFASIKHEDLPENLHESLSEVLENMLSIAESEFASLETTPGMGDIHPPIEDTNPDLPGGYTEGSGDSFDSIFTPSLLKFPMGKEKKERRIFVDFNEFLRRINYRTHGEFLQGAFPMRKQTGDI